jgi:hypothetical protein
VTTVAGDAQNGTAAAPRRSPVAALIALYCLSRVVLVAVGKLSLAVVGPGEWFGRPRGLFDALLRWDTSWYLSIVEKGYRYDPQGRYSNIAFLPLYPGLVKAVALVTGHAALVGVVLSNAAFALALVYLYRLASLDEPPEVAFRACLFLMLFPSAFFGSLVFTEGLFLLLGVAAVYHARQRRWVAASIAASLAALTRMVGLFLLVPLLLEYLDALRDAGGRIRLSAVRRDALAFLLVPAGHLPFMAYQAAAFGNPFLYLEVQRAKWSLYNTSPLEALRSLQGLPPYHRWLAAGLLLAAALLLATMVIGRMRASSVAYAGASLLFLATLSHLECLARFLLPVFPLAIAAGRLSGRRVVETGIIVASVSLLTLHFVLYVNGYWISG